MTKLLILSSVYTIKVASQNFMFIQIFNEILSSPPQNAVPSDALSCSLQSSSFKIIHHKSIIRVFNEQIFERF